MIQLTRATAVAALLLVSLFALAEDRPIPALTGRVVDETKTLAAEQKRALEEKLQAFEQRKGSQIAVLITGTTFPEPIELFSIRVADTWKIGRKGVGDGILVVVAKSDRVMRLEVGYGLEGAIPDATARRLIDEVFIPGFGEGQFYEGLSAGIDRLIKVIDGEPLPAVSQLNAGRGDPRSLESYFVLFIVAPILIALLVGVLALVVTLFGGGGGGGMPGRLGGGGGFGSVRKAGKRSAAKWRTRSVREALNRVC